jgi:hypothetical protein
MAAATARRGGGGLSLCLISAGVVKTLSLAAFTLAWTLKRAPMPEVALANSGAAGEWRLCHDGKCRALSDIFEHPIGVNVTVMRGCEP